MVYAHFAIGTTLANMVNVETYTKYPPHILPDLHAALLGPAKAVLMDGSSSRGGQIPHTWQVDVEARVNFRSYMQSIMGGWTTQSTQVYISTISEDGYYSPFLCYAERPYPGQTYQVSAGDWLREWRVDFQNLVLQSITKTGVYSITASDRLTYGDTSGGGFTLTMPSAAGVTTNTVYSVQKTHASNTLTIARAGSDTIDGSTSAALTANFGRLDLVSDGVSAWTSVGII